MDNLAKMWYILRAYMQSKPKIGKAFAIRGGNHMVYVLLGTGFEEVEAIAPVDLLRRAGIEVKTVGITGKPCTAAIKSALRQTSCRRKSILNPWI